MSPLPPTIATDTLGQLRLVEMDVGVWLQRHYEPSGPMPLKSTLAKTDEPGVGVVVWLPESGELVEEEFAAQVDRDWRTLATRIDEILDASIPEVELAIERFWRIPDEAPPTALALIRGGSIKHVNLGPGRDQHELHVHDSAGLIGFHDLIIHLDGAMETTGASFDG